jgi:hypothetical protein
LSIAAVAASSAALDKPGGELVEGVGLGEGEGEPDGFGVGVPGLGGGPVGDCPDVAALRSEASASGSVSPKPTNWPKFTSTCFNCGYGF